MKERFFVNSLHTATKRNYKSRVINVDKAEVSELAIKWGFDYWDGSRDTGYGGYKYDGRWKKVAAQLIDTYGLRPGMNVLDVGCGKGFLLNDLKELCPGLNVYGLDI
jgi:protein-L-isoaspartate(D-aspartate) O-methyltransferase